MERKISILLYINGKYLISIFNKKGFPGWVEAFKEVINYTLKEAQTSDDLIANIISNYIFGVMFDDTENIKNIKIAYTIEHPEDDPLLVNITTECVEYKRIPIGRFNEFLLSGCSWNFI